MKVPGFTAEASLYKARANGLASHKSESSPFSDLIQPALSIYIDGLYAGEGDIDCFGFHCVIRWRRS